MRVQDASADGFEAACQALGIDHRKTKPYTPQTNGMVERFNGRVQREVLGITGGGPKAAAAGKIKKHELVPEPPPLRLIGAV